MLYRLHGVKNANVAAPLIRLSIFFSLALSLLVKLLQPFLAPSFPADQLTGVLCYWVKWHLSKVCFSCRYRTPVTCLCSAHLCALHLRQNKEVWRGWRFLDRCPVSSTKADPCSLAKPPLPYHSPFNSSSSPRQERRGLTTRTGRSGVGLLPVVRPHVAGARVRSAPGGLRGRRPSWGQMDNTVDSVSESGESWEEISGSSCVVWSNWIVLLLPKCETSVCQFQ